MNSESLADKPEPLDLLVEIINIDIQFLLEFSNILNTAALHAWLMFFVSSFLANVHRVVVSVEMRFLSSSCSFVVKKAKVRHRVAEHEVRVHFLNVDVIKVDYELILFSRRHISLYFCYNRVQFLIT